MASMVTLVLSRRVSEILDLDHLICTSKATSDVVHPLSGTRWTLKHYTVALLVDLNAD